MSKSQEMHNGLFDRATVIGYRGKQWDDAAAVLLMAMGAVGVREVPHPTCLTTRPFARICPRRNPRLWLSPITEPWDGLLLAIETLGVRSTSRLMTTTSEDGSGWAVLEAIKEWLPVGPIILGPLDRNTVWDRIESRYYHGSAHFVLAVECRDDYHLVVHDPEGCPYLPIPQEKLLSALHPAGFRSGALQVISASRLHSPDSVFRQTLLAGARSRVLAAEHPEGGAEGLRCLAHELASRRLKSSEEGALSFALPALGWANRQVAEFLLDIPDNVATAFFQRGLKSEMMEILLAYVADSAEALEHLKKGNQGRLSTQILKMARKEAQLDNLIPQQEEMPETGIVSIQVSESE